MRIVALAAFLALGLGAAQGQQIIASPSLTNGTVTSVTCGTGLTGGAITGSGTCAADFGTASSKIAQGGVITAGGPTGSATVAPIITYNAAGQLTAVSSATIAGSTISTRQVLTSGTAATYTTPAGARQIKVRMVGAGGGGGGATANGGTVTGAAGGTTTFKDVTALGGSPGVQVGGAGGTGGATGTGTTSQWRIAGNGGGGGFEAFVATGTVSNPPSGAGGAGPWGGGGSSILGNTGVAGSANSGGGGSGAVSGAGPTNYQSAGGGGSGEYVEFLINSPAGTYTYTITAGGAGGDSTQDGGAGGSGLVIVDELY